MHWICCIVHGINWMHMMSESDYGVESMIDVDIDDKDSSTDEKKRI